MAELAFAMLMVGLAVVLVQRHAGLHVLHLGVAAVLAANYLWRQRALFRRA